MVQIQKGCEEIVASLFEYTEETLILSFLQGHMGRGWADRVDSPSCARVIVGDFCYVAGDERSPSALALVREIPSNFASDTLLIVPEHGGWGKLIEEVHAGRFQKFERYAIKKERDVFDKIKLQGLLAALPYGYEIKRIEGALYGQAMSEGSFRDFCSQFASEEDYADRGLGFCVTHAGEMVCGASSYTVYDGGIEIEIGTQMEHRRKGLAAACAARLILECLDRGLYPSWDAANLQSVRLAEKLGYHFDKTYDTYAVDMAPET